MPWKRVGVLFGPEKNKISFVSKVYMSDCRTFGKAHKILCFLSSYGKMCVFGSKKYLHVFFKIIYPEKLVQKIGEIIYKIPFRPCTINVDKQNIAFYLFMFYIS